MTRILLKDRALMQTIYGDDIPDWALPLAEATKILQAGDKGHPRYVDAWDSFGDQYPHENGTIAFISIGSETVIARYSGVSTKWIIRWNNPHFVIQSVRPWDKNLTILQVIRSGEGEVPDPR